MANIQRYVDSVLFVFFFSKYPPSYITHRFFDHSSYDINVKSSILVRIFLILSVRTH